MKHWGMRCCAAALVMLGATTAQAAMITTWTFYDEMGFAEYGGSRPISASGSSGKVLDLPTRLSWHGAGGGDDDDQPSSRLSTDGNDRGRVTTNGGFAQGSGFTYRDGSGRAGSLLSFTALNALKLTPIAPNPPYDGSITIDAPTLEFDLLFYDTPNSSTCADGTKRNAKVNQRGCRDIFALTNPQALMPMEFDLFGFTYTIGVVAPDLGVLSASACAAIGLPAGCIGVMTEERRTSEIEAFFFINGRPTDPQPMALLAAAASEEVMVEQLEPEPGRDSPAAILAATRALAPGNDVPQQLLVAQIPEPAPWMLLAGGIMLLRLGSCRRRYRLVVRK